MKNRFTITIHDDDGVKQFNAHSIVKKFLLYFLLAIGSTFIIGTGIIIYLNDSLNIISVKKASLENAYELQSDKNLELLSQTKEASRVLVAKQKELLEINDKLNDIEQSIGLRPNEGYPLLERIEIANMSTKEREKILKYIPSGSPVPYHGITSKFGYRIHPTLNRKEFHRGTDMRAKMNTEIRATADAVVEWAGLHKRSGYGRLIILSHNYGFRTYYGHLSKVVVKSGTFVHKGDLIGYTGNSGMSNGPHLHYEVRFLQRALNPFWFVKWNITNYNDIFKKEKNIPWQSLVAAITNKTKMQHQAKLEKLVTTPPLSSPKVLQ